MAGVPSIRRILREDLREAPSWIEKLISPLNMFMDSVYTALNKNLTFGENIKGQIKSFTIEAGAASTDNVFEFPATISGPQGVILLAAVQQGTTYTPLITSPQISSWSYSDNTVYIDSIAGLTAGEKYNIKVLVI